MFWLVAMSLAVQGFILEDVKPLEFRVNLDEPPSMRWKEVIIARREAIIEFGEIIESKISYWEKLLFSQFLYYFYLDDEIYQEILSAAEATNLDYRLFVLLSYYYEMNVFCTGVLARSKEGYIIHGRNLDYNQADLLRSLVVDVDFYRDNKLLYRATTLVGYFGIITGMKPGAFSISLNQRNPLSSTTAIENLLTAASGAMGNSILIRRTLETKQSFQEAVDYLSTQPIVTYCYYVVAGLRGNEGAIITRVRNYAEDIWYLSDDSWYIIQTNYDHWKLQPLEDDRVTPAKTILESLGQSSFNTASMWNLLSTRPIYKNSAVIHTNVMIPARKYYRAEVREIDEWD